MCFIFSSRKERKKIYEMLCMCSLLNISTTSHCCSHLHPLNYQQKKTTRRRRRNIQHPNIFLNILIMKYCWRKTLILCTDTVLNMWGSTTYVHAYMRERIKSFWWRKNICLNVALLISIIIRYLLMHYSSLETWL